VRIGIDARALQEYNKGGYKAGVGRYIFEICKVLDEELPDAIFILYSQKKIELPIVSSRWLNIRSSFFMSKIIKPVLWLKIICPILCRKDKLDIFWGAATFLPSLPKRVKKIITVYDLVHEVMPRSMTLTHKMSFKLFFRHDLKVADYIVSISKGTADKLQFYYGSNANEVIPPAADDIFRKQNKQQTFAVLEKYKINSDYILFVGTMEPRKNIKELIKCFQDNYDYYKLKNIKLVIAGGSGWGQFSIDNNIKNYEDIIKLGYVNDEELPHLYSGAKVFIFPSIYEGYGIPIIEALKCGTKVVCTDIEEHREAAFGQNIIFVKSDSNSLHAGLMSALTTRGTTLLNLPNNTWKQSGHAMANIFKNL